MTKKIFSGEIIFEFFWTVSANRLIINISTSIALWKDDGYGWHWQKLLCPSRNQRIRAINEDDNCSELESFIFFSLLFSSLKPNNCLDLNHLTSLNYSLEFFLKDYLNNFNPLSSECRFDTIEMRENLAKMLTEKISSICPSLIEIDEAHHLLFVWLTFELYIFVFDPIRTLHSWLIEWKIFSIDQNQTTRKE